jgi:hypothetical protein
MRNAIHSTPGVLQRVGPSVFRADLLWPWCVSICVIKDLTPDSWNLTVRQTTSTCEVVRFYSINIFLFCACVTGCRQLSRFNYPFLSATIHSCKYTNLVLNYIWKDASVFSYSVWCWIAVFIGLPFLYSLFWTPFWGGFFWVVLAVLWFEFRASCLLGRHYHLSHPASPFLVGYFSR